MAQTAAPAGSESSEAQASLERAQRQADNPMRHILRASRLPARVAVADAAPAAAGAAAVTATAAPAAPVVLSLTLPAAATAALTEAPALDTAAFGRVPSLPPAWPALPVLPVDDPLVPEQPQLLTMLEPELDLRLLDQLGRLKVVSAVLTLRMDGTVAEVSFRGTLDQRLQRVLERALLQWRYAPLRAVTEHPVQLDFSNLR
jgi:hypothetical protein